MGHPFSTHLPSGTWPFPQNRFFNVLLITTVQKTGILKRKSTKLNADTFNMYITELLVDRKKWSVAENASVPEWSLTFLGFGFLIWQLRLLSFVFSISQACCKNDIN